jgi:hypothetical protein
VFLLVSIPYSLLKKFFFAYNISLNYNLLYRLVIATMILLVINRGSLTSDEGFASTHSTRILIIVLAAVEGLTLFIWVIIRYIYPRIVKEAKWLDTIWWWKIKQSNNLRLHEEVAVGCFRYYAWESYRLCFRHGSVTYIGEVDANGRPHGHGEWVDDSSDGECLKGKLYFIFVNFHFKLFLYNI